MAGNSIPVGMIGPGSRLLPKEYTFHACMLVLITANTFSGWKWKVSSRELSEQAEHSDELKEENYNVLSSSWLGLMVVSRVVMMAVSLLHSLLS